MGEITEFIELYIEDANLLEDILDEISLKLVENIQNQLYGPTPQKHGRVTGNLRDNIQSDFTSEGLTGIVRGYIGDSAPYGEFVNEGHSLRNDEWWEGYHFLEAGLEETAALYR